jgi:hypothetical protein
MPRRFQEARHRCLDEPPPRYPHHLAGVAHPPRSHVVGGPCTLAYVRDAPAGGGIGHTILVDAVRRVVQRRPATFGEVHDRVDTARLSHYLDGPMDADWILSNELLAEREGNVYVDFVWDIEGNSGQWMTPARLDDIGLGPGTAVQDLLLSLGQTGCLSRRGLDVIADEWHDFDLTEDTPWVKVHDVTIRILTRLHEAGHFAETASQADVDRVLEQWGFPLGALDLSEIKVSREELRAEQQRLLSRWID